MTSQNAGTRNGNGKRLEVRQGHLRLTSVLFTTSYHMKSKKWRIKIMDKTSVYQYYFECVSDYNEQQQSIVSNRSNIACKETEGQER